MHALWHEIKEAARTLFYATALSVAPKWAARRIAAGALTRNDPPRPRA